MEGAQGTNRKLSLSPSVSPSLPLSLDLSISILDGRISLSLSVSLSLSLSLPLSQSLDLYLRLSPHRSFSSSTTLSGYFFLLFLSLISFFLSQFSLSLHHLLLFLSTLFLSKRANDLEVLNFLPLRLGDFPRCRYTSCPIGTLYFSEFLADMRSQIRESCLLGYFTDPCYLSFSSPSRRVGERRD